MKIRRNRKNIPLLIIAPIPPPYHGLSIASRQYIQHLRTSDYKFINTAIIVDAMGSYGKFNFSKLFRDFRILFAVIINNLKYEFSAMYLTISQTSSGLLRDSVLICLCKSFQCSVIIHLHGGNLRNVYDKQPKLYQWIVRRNLAKVDKAVVLSNSFKWIFKDLVKEENILVVPNGIPDTRHLHAKQSDTKRILFLSNLIETKGVMEALQTINIIEKQGIPIKASFAGEWFEENYKNKILKWIDSENLSSVITIEGRSLDEQKEELYAKSDIFLFPTYSEGLPIVVIEAMRSGLPIIATSVGAIPDLVIDGYNGFLINRKDTVETAERLITLLTNDDLLVKMGKRSRELYLENYTEENYLRNLDMCIGSAVRKDA